MNHEFNTIPEHQYPINAVPCKTCLRPKFDHVGRYLLCPNSTRRTWFNDKVAMPSAEAITAADTTIRKRVESLRLSHPNLIFSYGYIGNLEFWGDDRRWRVGIRPSYLRTVWEYCHTGRSVTTAELPELATNFDEWVLPRVAAAEKEYAGYMLL